MAGEPEGAGPSPLDHAELCGLLAELDPDQGAGILQQLYQAAVGLDADVPEEAQTRAEAALAVAVLLPDRAQELIRPVIQDIRPWDPFQQPPSANAQPPHLLPMGPGGPSPGDPVMPVAARIALQDPDGALRLLQAVPDLWFFDPEVREVFRAMAKVDPEKALEALQRTTVDHETVLPEVLSEFPADQLERALELAGKIANPRSRATALARLCFVGPRERVPELIDAAMNVPARSYPAGGIFGPDLDAQTLAQLASVARRLGYGRHEEIVLWAAGRQMALMGPVGLPGVETYAELPLARVLAFTAPELARGLIESFVTDHGGIGSIDAYLYELLAAAAAEVDVRWAASLIDQMAPDEPRRGRPYRALAVLPVCEVLLGDPDERERALLREWLPGDDDT